MPLEQSTWHAIWPQLLEAEAVLTGDASTQGRLALDTFGEAWGWTRGGEARAWHQLMQSQALEQPLSLAQQSGTTLWSSSAGSQRLNLLDGSNPSAALIIGAGTDAAACRWHPATLWIGIGCERNTSESLVERAVASVLDQASLAPEAVAGISSIDAKADEPALLRLSERARMALSAPQRFQPGKGCRAHAIRRGKSGDGYGIGRRSSGSTAAGDGAPLRHPKQIFHAEPGEQGAVTVAIAEASQAFAPQRGELHLIGSGPGALELLTPDATQALSRCVTWVGYGLYLDLLEPLRRHDQVRVDGQLTRERDRCQQALEMARAGTRVALVSSGDSGIYGMAGLALELWMDLPESDRPLFQVHPGLSALQLAAAKAGAPLMHDFCTISLSDRLTPWEVIERRLHAAAAGDFVVALYNPRSKGRDWQLQRAIEILLTDRPATTPVVMARQLGRREESVRLFELASLKPEDVDMLTVLVIGNSSSRVMGGRMVTPVDTPEPRFVDADQCSRDDRIRTCGPFVPNEVRYQAALHPDGPTLEDDLRPET